MQYLCSPWKLVDNAAIKLQGSLKAALHEIDQDWNFTFQIHQDFIWNDLTFYEHNTDAQQYQSVLIYYTDVWFQIFTTTPTPPPRKRERYVRGRRKIKTNGFYVWCWRSWIVQGAVRKLKTKLCWIYRWSQKKLSGSSKIFVAKTFQIKRVKCVNF